MDKNSIMGGFPASKVEPAYIKYSIHIWIIFAVSLIISLISYNKVRYKEEKNNQVQIKRDVLARLILAISTLSVITCIILKIVKYMHNN